jgi:hypothetical protein
MLNNHVQNPNRNNSQKNFHTFGRAELITSRAKTIIWIRVSVLKCLLQMFFTVTHIFLIFLLKTAISAPTHFIISLFILFYCHVNLSYFLYIVHHTNNPIF